MRLLFPKALPFYPILFRRASAAPVSVDAQLVPLIINKNILSVEKFGSSKVLVPKGMGLLGARNWNGPRELNRAVNMASKANLPSAVA